MIKVYSIFVNVKKFVERKKFKDENLDELKNKVAYNRTPMYVKKKCADVSRYIKNGFFTLDDFKIYCLHMYFTKDKIQWSDVKVSNILLSKKGYCPANLKKSKNFLLDLNKKIKFKNIDMFYKINSDGSNVMYDLVKKGYIHPILYVKMHKNKPEKGQFKQCKQMDVIDRISTKLHEILT